MTYRTHVTATRREMNVNVRKFGADIRNFRYKILKRMFLTRNISKDYNKHRSDVC
jgi:hypothetical protein